jgi:hypothetical protein
MAKPAKKTMRKANKAKLAAREQHSPVIVTVTDAKLDQIESVASSLRAEGMKVERVLPKTGVISGSYAPSKMENLRGVDGVESVEQEAVAVLPPPGSTVQ